MSTFEQLHPSVQHHVVNSLGWSSLRPHQEQAIGPILAGEHVLIQAPTAGGKTEAALLPILSRMLQEEWGAPSVLYLCPIKALLNDLEMRVEALARLVGRRIAVWHGDVNTAARRRILREPPDILLATPESVEVVLVSRLVDHCQFFAPLRAAIVDEVHAFAGDDRGWHLLSLLERVSRLAEEPVQRIALSATLANAGELLDWLAAERDEPRAVIEGAPPAQTEVDVEIDYVGSLSNAALVISRLHQGEKRLVFCDSRSQVEELASELRYRGVDTYVSHSSLSRDERLRAEAAFAQGTNCVIVATSTLELGIDVGDLDRVIQVDAPYTVASFLQRLGRSGRRAGERRNCLFLATTEDTLLRAAAIVQLWREGFVEPVRAPALPYHVLAQQVLALTLQGGACALHGVGTWLSGLVRTAGITAQDLDALIAFMLEEGILFEDGGILSVGLEGEARYGQKNFLEIFSVFMSPPLFDVYHGRRALGRVHENSFRQSTPMLISLGGRGWRVTHFDWDARRAYVEPSKFAGRSRWLGTGQPMHFELAQSVKRVVEQPQTGGFLSRRATDQLAELHEAFAWSEPGATTLLQDRKHQRAAWWTFAGDRYNAAAATALASQGVPATYDSFALRIASPPWQRLPDLIVEAAQQVVHAPQVTVRTEMLQRFKFSDCLSPPLQQEMLEARLDPSSEAQKVAEQPVRTVTL